MIYGTLVTSLIALVIAVPVSFGIALFLTELSPAWLKRPLGTAIELLAAVPSIVYGMWGLLVFGPILSHLRAAAAAGAVRRRAAASARWSPGPPVGIGILSAGIILAIMIIPFIASVMRDVFEVTPPMLKESAYGLGSTTWEVVSKVVLPYTKTGVVGGIMLGLGRALGETMAVTFVIGNYEPAQLAVAVRGRPTASPRRSPTSSPRPATGLHQASLIYLGLVLFFITFVVLSLSKLLLPRLRKREGTQAHERRERLLSAKTPRSRARRRLRARRKRVNVVALTLSLAAMAFGVFWLVWILCRDGAPRRRRPDAGRSSPR